MKKIDGLEPMEYIWSDKKRILGMPISFTRYSLSKDRLFMRKGLLTTTQEEILLYRVRDLTVTQTLWQKIFGVGTVTVHSSDKTNAHLDIKNVKMPFDVKELLHKHIEIMKKENRLRASEYLTDDVEDVCDDDMD